MTLRASVCAFLNGAPCQDSGNSTSKKRNQLQVSEQYVGFNTKSLSLSVIGLAPLNNPHITYNM